MLNGGAGRRRPLSTYQLESHSPRMSPLPPPSSHSHVPLPIMSSPKPPAPLPSSNSDHATPTSDPAPPPPPRTLSKHADPVHKYVAVFVCGGNNSVCVCVCSSVTAVGIPVPPTRKKRVMSMFPDQMEASSVSDLGLDCLPGLMVVCDTQPQLVVTALYDCEPDQQDELGFKEGEKIVVTKKLSKDWWVSGYPPNRLLCERLEVMLCFLPIQKGYVIHQSNRKGIFPKNYVTELDHQAVSSMSGATPPLPQPPA